MIIGINVLILILLKIIWLIKKEIYYILLYFFSKFLKKNIILKFYENVKKLTLNDVKWSSFYIKEIFDGGIKMGQRLEAKNLILGNIPFITAIQSNNGITEYISINCVNNKKKSMKLFKPSIIINNFGDAFYQEKQFFASDSVGVLSNKHLNKYNGFFLVSLLAKCKDIFSFSFAVTPNNFIKHISLPNDELGRPNWKFMEEYIKEIFN